MRIVFFCHSVVSDWNNGNAHFQRGVTRALQRSGHDVVVFEPRDSWSRTRLERDHGPTATDAFRARFPTLRVTEYDLGSLDLDGALDGADLVIVHEWNEPDLVARVGERRSRGGFKLLFHDTHHRAVTAPDEMARFDLSRYDGVIAFGDVIRDLYLERRWAQRAWTWHEAADTEVFRPIVTEAPQQDLVWIGNWADRERARELDEYLLRPARALGLTGTIHGVRYPSPALARVRDSGLVYRGWLANHDVPHVFARHRATVHVPRRPYVRALPGIPTIRMFEALACGIPLVSAPWMDSANLFRAGVDHLVAEDSEAMTRHLKAILHDPDTARELSSNGLETIRSRHTCAHRAAELMSICEEL